ncbi:Smr domain [Kingella potus]|uniref:Smr domain n=1 Tax=Kingella potus TaxID=265175 RepID=A0A377QZ08_9NEIS|nr:Smr/MutS family protein [Kingella potus]UOP01676.1 Smr/MutS family protein [Kingella potus]STR00025.1 Smr domain [Kingella potus]
MNTENSFRDTLEALGRQAKRQSEAEKAKQRANAKQQAEEPDFAALMADVTPLKNTNRRPPERDTTPIKPRPKDNARDDDDGNFYIGDGQWTDIPAEFSKNGRGQADIKRLQSGYYAVCADVDLHGYTQEEAQQVLNEFIVFVQKRGVCGEIIHGSGLGSAGYRPKLKHLVRRWLMLHPEVLAYAEPHKGNDGAVRILLKRRRGPEEENGQTP